jgi:DNA polymerase elongation subunit (family B)
MSTLYLLDATVTETNSIKLRFLKADGRLAEFVDDKYRPYFYIACPLTAKEKEIVKYFSGEDQLTEKIDLYTNEKRMLTKVYWPNPKISSKAGERFGRCWEKEIEFTRSYVYDKGLIFGASYSENGPCLTSDTKAEAKEKLEETFREMRVKDPLKYAQIAHWFNLLNQPIPTISPKLLGMKEVASEKVYAAWMLSRIANVPLTQAFSSVRVSDWIKPMIHTYLRRNNILIPTAEELRREKTTHSVTGALTVSPKAGIYFNTVVCDFESLYPSCIDSFNLSYETVDCPHPECGNNRIPDVDYHVCSKRRGFYSILVGALKELRIRIFKPASKDNSLPEEKRKKADAVAKLLKLILVSSYGVTVRIHGVACPPLAEAITGYGRYVLKESWKLAEQGGLRPLYGDTDSLFLDNVLSDQVGWLIKTVKERFSLDLAVDKRYSLCVLPKAKKAYFGILPDGTPDIKGVTAIKSNSPGYIKNVFQQCVRELSGVGNQDGYEQVKERIKAIVRKSTVDLRNRSVKLGDLTYSVRLYFDPSERAEDMKALHQPYQCALQLIDAGRTLGRGETVSFVKVKPFNYKEKIFTVKPAEFVTSLSEINVDDYIRNLLTALNQTFEPMSITLEIEKERETQISKWLTG